MEMRYRSISTLAAVGARRMIIGVIIAPLRHARDTRGVQAILREVRVMTSYALASDASRLFGKEGAALAVSISSWGYSLYK